MMVVEIFLNRIVLVGYLTGELHYYYVDMISRKYFEMLSVILYIEKDFPLIYYKLMVELL